MLPWPLLIRSAILPCPVKFKFLCGEENFKDNSAMSSILSCAGAEQSCDVQRFS